MTYEWVDLWAMVDKMGHCVRPLLFGGGNLTYEWVDPLIYATIHRKQAKWVEWVRHTYQNGFYMYKASGLTIF